MLTTVAGNGTTPDSGDGGLAIAAGFFAIDGVAVDPAGRIYVLDRLAGRVRRIDVDGTIATVAGGVGDFGDGAGDGGPARAASLGFVQSVSVDDRGRLLITSSRRIRRVDADGIIPTVVGGGDGVGDGIEALSAGLAFDIGFVKDQQGRLVISDPFHSRVLRLEADGSLTTIAGDAAGTLERPYGLAVDRRGRVYVADAASDGFGGAGGDGRVVRVETDGTLTTIAGGGPTPPVPGTSVALSHIGALAVDGADRVLLADGKRLRALEQDGTLATQAAPGGAADLRIDDIGGVTFDPLGRLVIANRSRRTLERIDADGTVTRLAGGGASNEIFVGTGDGGPALDATFSVLFGALAAVVSDAQGRLFAIDRDFDLDRVRRIDVDGTIDAFAGGGSPFVASVGDGGPATDAFLSDPSDLAVDAAGRIYIADRRNHRIRRVDVDGTITTVAGSGPTDCFFCGGFAGDGGPATAARLDLPLGVAVDHPGRLWIADSGNHRVRRVEPDGTIHTIAGTGDDANTGDGGPATAAAFAFVGKLRVDAVGNVFVDGGSVLRRIDAAGIVTTVAGGSDVDLITFFGDGGPATAAGLSEPTALAFDALDRLYIADSGHDRVRRVELDGTITTIAGTNPRGLDGDGGPATATRLSYPNALAFDPLGRLAITDSGHNQIRRIEEDGTLTTLAGTGATGITGDGDGGPATEAVIETAYIAAIAFDAAGRLYLTERNAGSIRRVEQDGTIHTLTTLYDGGRCEPVALVVEPDGTLLTTDECGSEIIAIAPDGRIKTIVGGSGSGDGLPATRAVMFDGVCAAGDALGGIVVVDGVTLRRVGDDGVIRRVAGFDNGYAGDGGPSRDASLSRPRDVGVDHDGAIYVADTGNRRLRRVDPDGTIDTVAGTGVALFSGDAHPAQTLQAGVSGVALDPQGRVIFTSADTARIQRLEDDGTLTTLAGNGQSGFSRDGDLATATAIAPSGPLAIDRDGRITFADDGSFADERQRDSPFCCRHIRRVELDGTVTTLVGLPLEPGIVYPDEGRSDFSGIAAAQWFLFGGVSALTVDPHGRLHWIEDALSGGSRTTRRSTSSASPTSISSGSSAA